MVPEGAFRVWCETADDMDAVCVALQASGITWASGRAMARWRYTAHHPCGIVVDYSADRSIVQAKDGERKAYVTQSRTNFFSSVSHAFYHCLPRYTVDDIVGDAFDVSSCDVSSVFSIIEY